MDSTKPSQADQAMRQRPPPAPPRWLARNNRLYTAAMRRFWLDEFEDWLITQPTLQLSHELKRLDEDVVTRMAGLQAQATAVASVNARSVSDGYVNIEAGIATGRGLLGRLLEKPPITCSGSKSDWYCAVGVRVHWRHCRNWVIFCSRLTIF